MPAAARVKAQRKADPPPPKSSLQLPGISPKEACTLPALPSRQSALWGHRRRPQLALPAGSYRRSSQGFQQKNPRRVFTVSASSASSAPSL